MRDTCICSVFVLYRECICVSGLEVRVRASDTLYRDVSHVYRPVSCRHIVIWDVRLDTYRYMHDTYRYNDANTY